MYRPIDIFYESLTDHYGNTPHINLHRHRISNPDNPLIVID